MERKEWMNPERLNLLNKSDAISYLTHLKAYEFVEQYVYKKKVIEVGCGSGYGIKKIASKTIELITVDKDQNSLDYARNNNYHEKIKYVNADVLEGLPFTDDNFNICICFQVIEHISDKDLPLFIGELKRVTKKNGIIIFTTPNRRLRLQPFQKPINTYHKNEYSVNSFQNLLNKHFNQVELYGLASIEEIIEYKRKNRQTKFQAYIRNPVRKIIVYATKTLKFKRAYTFFEERTIKGTFNKPESDKKLSYQLSDFWFTQKNLNEAIDFLSVCHV